jgi:DNA gyrase inhibitor GyrI
MSPGAMARGPRWRVEDGADLDVVERALTATRVLGVAHRAPRRFADLAALTRTVANAAVTSGAGAGSPIVTVLRANPWEVAPSRRHYFTCTPVSGAVTPPPDFAVETLPGGLFVIAMQEGGLGALDAAFGFLFGRLLPARGHELAREEIRLVYPTAPHEVAREADLVTQIAVPVVLTMRNDTMRNQR